MRRAAKDRNIRRNARGAGSTLNPVRRIFMGGMATVLALAGLVVFATEASAHDNVFQSVTAACNAPGSGAGATLTWTLYNDWNQSETGTFSTGQGTLSTTALSIGASPTANAVPPAAVSQAFTQTFSASQLAALSAGSIISVNWNATWTDGTNVPGALTTSLAALNLPNGCDPTPTTPTVGTTLLSPASTAIGNSWGDSASVTGSTSAPAPAGAVTFFICKATGPSCSSGGAPVGTVGSPSSSTGSTSTYTLGTRYTPTLVGTYCFYTTYAPSSGEPYLPASGPAECFAVTQAYPGIMTTVATPSTPTLGKSWSDSATVNGEYGGGTPTGSVNFYACEASTTPGSSATCTDTSDLVGTVSTPSSTSDVSATYDLSPTTFTPPSMGTWCFYTLYQPTNANYFPVWGPPECFSVYAAGTVTTTHTSAGVIVIGGSAFDTATVTGDSAHGAPTGTVTFYSCSTPGGTGCTGGTEIPGTTDSPNPATLTASGSDTSTASSPSITPSSPGTYCFGAVYTPNVTKYTGSSDNMHGGVVWNECFTVGRATPTIATTLATPTSTGVGNAWGDSATVTGVPAGGPPAGSVSFSVCEVASGETSCSSGGTPVGTVASPTSTSGDVSTYDLGATYTPTTIGTFCFYSVYTPASVDNYTAASGPAECFTVTPATPTIATTLVTPSSTTVGNAWGDSATVTGNTTGGAPTGSVSFSVCEVASGATSCTMGGTLVGTVTSPSSTSGDVSTYDLKPTYTPANVGTYCFYSVYTPATGDNYASASGPAECFTVTPAAPMLSTQQSGSHAGAGSVTLGTSVTDVATIVGNPTSAAPTGTITFTECSTGSAPAVCPSGNAVGSAVTLSSTGDSSSATSAAFEPSTTGTYCFAAVYTPDTGSNYVTADDNMSGTVSASECFTVTAITTAATTITPTSTAATSPTTTPTTSPTTSASTTPVIAFTGALLSQEWLVGLAALVLGSGLVLVARRRRRSPRHARR